MGAEAVTKFAAQLTHNNFGFRVEMAYGSHDSTALFLGKRVGHFLRCLKTPDHIMPLATLTAVMPEDYLSFTFAPHVLEDLGVNLYTSVSKALVEFVANAHDADAKGVKIQFDPDKITHAKGILKTDFDFEKAKLEKDAPETSLKPLAERTLPEEIQLVIEDDGDGMTRADLEHKFLVIGRRRRKGKEKSARTNKGRIVMGRKGLGKLAGFGIAHVIEVTSKVESEAHATQITLDLDQLLGNSQPPPKENAPHDKKNINLAADSKEDVQAEEKPAIQAQVQVPVRTVADGAGLIKGTRIVLKKLVYDALRGELVNHLSHAFAENFYGIKTADFAINVNGTDVDTSFSDFAFAYPEDSKPKTDLVDGTVPVDAGLGQVTFKYRIRFRPSKKQLPAKERGVRVYAHHRLASVPDLLDVKSSAHGFQYTSYLDGVVVADFIDDQPTDYISTDRQTLRWDTPILLPLREFLTDRMTKALATYADSVSEKLEKKLKDDDFTKKVIFEGKLPPHREDTAWKLAKTLAGKDSGDLESEFYRSTIRSVVAGLGHGEILATIQRLAEQDHPQLKDVIAEITRLTRHEFDEFVTIIDARLRAIETLSKLVKDVDFKKSKNEDDLHDLFEQNPWLIDPTFFEFLTSDQEESILAERLSKELKIDYDVSVDYDPTDAKEADSVEVNPLAKNERPDLTFLLTNESLKRIVIVELKAPNTPLHIDHLNQLKGYMDDVEAYAEAHPECAGMKVEGILIGSRATNSKAAKIKRLESEIKKYMGPNSDWRVFDIAEILNRTKAAHHEIWDAYKKASVKPTTVA